MAYYTKVAFNQNLISPQSKIIQDTFISVNDIKSCFLNPDDCIPDNHEDFKEVKIGENISSCFFDELKELDNLLLDK